MKYLDYRSLLEGPGVDLALFSTFQFDPDYFERRLLRCERLAGARRILVFMDGSRWSELSRREAPARWLNRRYLVLPAYQPQGVFHAKLALLVSGASGQVLCGSNNLTRAGCSGNLELLNAIPFEASDLDSDGVHVAREALAFFKRAVERVAAPLRRIGTSWIEEIEQSQPWLSPARRSAAPRVALVHSYSATLWEQLEEHLKNRASRAFFVMAPFHDARAESCRRLVSRWPRAKIELAVQQGYTNLQPAPLRKVPGVQLTEIVSSSRRLHAKLIAWAHSKGWGCLVGSANFTSAALHGPNIEACLLLSEVDDPSEALFDSQLKKRRLALEDFEPGPAEEREHELLTIASLQLDAVVLTASNTIHVSYSNNLGLAAHALRLEIRTPGEALPRAVAPLRLAARGSENLQLAEGCLADAHGTVLATLSAQVAGTVVRSAPVWIVQERHLTYEPAASPPSKRHQVEETGEGLPELLDEIGSSQGLVGVVEYLRHLSIRFHDGSEGIGRPRGFRVRPRDPFVGDRPPDWILSLREPPAALQEAIYDFVDRHERLRLRKHAERGNINGMQNFMDIFATLTRLLLVFHRRGVVKRAGLIGRYCDLIAVATKGRDTEEVQFRGFLASIFSNIGRDSALLQEACDETSYLAEVRAALLIVQDVRSTVRDRGTGRQRQARPRALLEIWAGLVRSAIQSCRLQEPSVEEVREGLARYGVLQKGEVSRLLKELPL